MYCYVLVMTENNFLWIKKKPARAAAYFLTSGILPNSPKRGQTGRVGCADGRYAEREARGLVFVLIGEMLLDCYFEFLFVEN